MAAVLQAIRTLTRAGPADTLRVRRSMAQPPSHRLCILGALFLVGCPESTAPPAPGPDAGPSDAPAPEVDTDGDGLCDDTEVARLTDPEDSDTDGDGYSDYVEAIFGYDPRVPSSPARDDVVSLREHPEASVQVTVSVIVRGAGEDFTGAFEALSARDPLGLTALGFYERSVALFANPEANVAVMEPDAERFGGVIGTTQLNYEVRLAFGPNLERRCLRAYPFRYVVKRSDGRVVSSARRLLVIVPVGETIAGGAWCAPSGPCF